MSTDNNKIIDHQRLRYPCCILWSPLPPITWILPFIGHTGIADQNGVIYDFAGPYTIGRINMAFGPPTRYLKLDPNKCTLADWQAGVEEGCECYSHRMHNICCDNCHSHIAKCLNVMGYGGKKNYNMINIGVWMFFSSSFVHPIWSRLAQFAPFLIIVFIAAFFGGYFS